MGNNRIKILYGIILFLCFSCKEPAPQVPANKLPESTLSEDLMLLNKEFVRFENEEIDKYIDSLKLNMIRTNTGLRYQITKEGTGRIPKKGEKITIKYSVRLLNGTVCKELNNVTKTIEIGKGGIERGIEESVLLLSVSGEGNFIIPSHLAFGVSGYKDCISGWSPIFCEITLIDSK